MATVTLLVTARAGPPGPARIPEPERAEARIRPERPIGRGRGEAAGGCRGAEKNLSKSGKVNDAATKNKLQAKLKIIDNLKSKTGAGAKSEPGTSLARWQCRAGDDDLVAVRPAGRGPPGGGHAGPSVSGGHHRDLSGHLVCSWRMAMVR